MAIYRYTREELLHLRSSPLAQKPSSLPSVDQWLDESQEARKHRNQPGRTEEVTASPMGNFSSQQRPSLLQTRQPSRASGDTVVLGPPKTSFASSRSINRLADSGEGITLQSIADEDRDLESLSARTKYFRERDEQSAKAGFGKEKDSWITSKGNKTYEARTGYGDKERNNGRNNRDRQAEGEDEAGRRNGYGYKHDQRWSRDGDKPSARGPGQERSWRERDRDRRYDRDNERSAPQEKEPEWMDEPLEVEEEQAHTVAEFEKWKQRMKAGNSSQPVEKENIETEMGQKSPPPKSAVSLMPETGFGSTSFGTWGDQRQETALPIQPEAVPAKQTASAGKKSSRFASMFAPKEEPRPQFEAPTSPLPLSAAANGSVEDREGFNRMLQMLRGTTMGPSGSSAEAASSPGAQGPSILNLFGASGSESKEPAQSQTPQNTGLQALFGRPSTGHGGRNPSQPESAISPQPPARPTPNRNESESRQQSRPQEMQSIFLDQGGPPRNVSTPEAQSIQSLLAGQRTTKTPALNKDSEFLLNLIQTKNASRPPSQAARPPEQDNFQLFLDQPPKPQAHGQGPQQRGPPPPPGFFPDQIYSRERGPGQEGMPEDRQNMPPRPPPGFFDDPMMHLPPPSKQQLFSPNEPQSPQQRRQPGAGGPPPGFPPQHHPDHQIPPFYRPGPGPNGSSNDRLPQSQAPPGFPPNLRHPSYTNMPNIFPQQPNQPHNPHHGPMPPNPNTLPLPPGAMRGPPGLSSPLDGPQSAPPNGQGPFNGMQAPPGFFGGPSHVPGVPPGFGGQMPPGMQGMGGIRSPIDGFGGEMRMPLGMMGMGGPMNGGGVRSPEMFLQQQQHAQGQGQGQGRR